MIEKQLDIFGVEHDVIDIDKKSTKKSIKEKFRNNYGYKNGEFCKNCKFHHRLEYHYKYYHKCEKIGISNSVATDIRLSDIACSLFQTGN